MLYHFLNEIHYDLLSLDDLIEIKEVLFEKSYFFLVKLILINLFLLLLFFPQNLLILQDIFVDLCHLLLFLLVVF